MLNNNPKSRLIAGAIICFNLLGFMCHAQYTKLDTAALHKLPIFQEENIVREEVTGLKINEDGSWSERKDEINEADKANRNEQLREIGKKAMAEAKSVFETRFSRSFVLAQRGKKANDGTLYGNNLVGCSFYYQTDAVSGKKQISGFGTTFDIRFNRTEVEFWRNGFVGMQYKLMPKEVVVFTRFNQLAFRIPYPFPSHVFKGTTGNVIPGMSNTYVEFMNVPQVTPCSNLGDVALMERIKGQTFVGYTENKDIEINLGNGDKIHPALYTVVKIDSEGYMTICYPLLKNGEAIVYDNCKVGGTIIKSGKENIAFVKNDGYAFQLMGSLQGNLYMLSKSTGNSANTKKANSISKKSSLKRTSRK